MMQTINVMLASVNHQKALKKSHFYMAGTKFVSFSMREQEILGK